MTEQEVVNGIILPNNNVDHTLAFIREIRNINIGLIHHAGKYIDINMAEKKVDQEAVDLLNLLKNIKVMMISLLSKKSLNYFYLILFRSLTSWMQQTLFQSRLNGLIVVE